MLRAVIRRVAIGVVPALGMVCVGAVLVLVLVFVLAGCGGSSHAGSTASSTPPATAAISPSTTTSTSTSTSASGSASSTPGASATAHNSGPGAKPAEQLAKTAPGSPAASAAVSRITAGFTACLRRHGVHFQTTGAGVPVGLDTKSAAFLKARGECLPVLREALKAVTKRVTPRAAPASHHALLVRFAACMRSDGVSNYPEPRGESVDLAAAHIDILSSTFRGAQRHCEALLARQSG